MQQYMEFVSNHTILSIVWVVLLGAVLFSFFKEKTANYKIVMPNEATRLMNHENAVVVDIRSRDEFRQGHITDAIHILPDNIKGERFGELEKHKSSPIIVVCKTGQTAQDNASALRKAGFENVNVLKDGLGSWNQENLPLVRKGKK